MNANEKKITEQSEEIKENNLNIKEIFAVEFTFIQCERTLKESHQNFDMLYVFFQDGDFEGLGEGYESGEGGGKDLRVVLSNRPRGNTKSRMLILIMNKSIPCLEIRREMYE